MVIVFIDGLLCFYYDEVRYWLGYFKFVFVMCDLFVENFLLMGGCDCLICVWSCDSEIVICILNNYMDDVCVICWRFVLRENEVGFLLVVLVVVD